MFFPLQPPRTPRLRTHWSIGKHNHAATLLGKGKQVDKRCQPDTVIQAISSSRYVRIRISIVTGCHKAERVTYLWSASAAGVIFKSADCSHISITLQLVIDYEFRIIITPLYNEGPKRVMSTHKASVCLLCSNFKQYRKRNKARIHILAHTKNTDTMTGVAKYMYIGGKISLP